MKSFDTTFVISAPAYYTTGSSTIYLVPGEEIRIEMGKNASSIVFDGTTTEANDYLKGIRWSDSGKLGIPAWGERPPLEEQQRRLDSAYNSRLDALSALQEVGERFVANEKARLVADIISVYLGRIYQSEFYKWDATPAEKESNEVEFYKTIKSDVEPLLASIDGDDVLLEVEKVREMLLKCHKAGCFAMNVSPRLAELIRTIEVSKRMDKGFGRDDYQELAEFAKGIKDPGLKEAFEHKLQIRSRLMEGEPAVDFTMHDTEGAELKLSDLKGQVLYVDFWATWCLPCIAQSPHFTALSEEYPNIRFVGISIDLQHEKWEAKMDKDGAHGNVTDYIADPFEMQNAWDLGMIPRFLLIDADFRIITAFAPRPSETELIRPLLKRLSDRN